jgi:hypothetical protein
LANWVTPGHPLFEGIREYVVERVRPDLQRGSVFYDLHTREAYLLDLFTASVKDGRGSNMHKRIFAVRTDLDGTVSVKQPTIFLDLALAPQKTTTPAVSGLPERQQVEQVLIEQALNPFLVEVAAQREREIKTITKHVKISLNELIHRQNLRLAELLEKQQVDERAPLLAANIKQAEDRLDELNGRLERRRQELQQESQCTLGDIQHVGSSWVLPHPERNSPAVASMVRDEEIERLAVEAVKAYEGARGWQVESVEDQNRGFDLISRKPHPEDPKTAIEVRFIEVKGRAVVGEVAVTTNEYKTAERLKKDYWLYVVFNCSTNPEVCPIQDPVRLGWEPLVKIEHYHVDAEKILSVPC